MLGLAQCKKDKTDTAVTPETPVTPVTPTSDTVNITLYVDDYSKHYVATETGKLVFTEGDVVYVGNDGKYVGTLTYADGCFSGNIYSPSPEDYLHCYFAGGLTPSVTLEEGSTTSFSVDISDQTENLPILSYGQTYAKYVEGETIYRTRFQNQCGLVKFIPSVGTSANIMVGNMKTKANIDFASGITPADETGIITLYPESDAAKWAVLLPQAEVSNPTVTIPDFISSIEKVPAISNGTFLNAGIIIDMTLDIPQVEGVFSVSNAKKTVKFSKGNLVYDKSAGTFYFMDNQFSTVEEEGQNVGEDYSNQNTISLFGWGTSGWNNGNVFYMPYNTSNADIPGNLTHGYGPWDEHNNCYSLVGAYANADWGVYNNIINGDGHSWRLLTREEMIYMLGAEDVGTPGVDYRNCERRFMKAVYRVNGVTIFKGLVILPDGFDDVVLSTEYTYNHSVWYQYLQPADWLKMEAYGAVVLPAAGNRNDTAVNHVGENGAYWMSDNADHINASLLFFGDYAVDPINSNPKYYGLSVRLVRE